MRNLSTIQASEIPAIRKLLEQDLKTRGVLAGGAESANAIRVTLSEDARERLWVAEVVEGSVTRVAMVHVDAVLSSPTTATERIVLRKERMLLNRTAATAQDDPILAAAEVSGHLVVMFSDRVSIFTSAAGGWNESNTLLMEKKPARDPRGILIPAAGGEAFAAYAPGAECEGSYSLLSNAGGENSRWTLHCRASDDPWPVYQTADASSAPALRPFTTRRAITLPAW